MLRILFIRDGDTVKAEQALRKADVRIYELGDSFSDVNIEKFMFDETPSETLISLPKHGAFSKDWTQRLTAWFNRDDKRKCWYLDRGPWCRRSARIGGQFYTLSNGLTIFAETLFMWGA